MRYIDDVVEDETRPCWPKGWLLELGLLARNVWGLLEGGPDTTTILFRI